MSSLGGNLRAVADSVLVDIRQAMERQSTLLQQQNKSATAPAEIQDFMSLSEEINRTALTRKCIDRLRNEDADTLRYFDWTTASVETTRVRLVNVDRLLGVDKQWLRVDGSDSSAATAAQPIADEAAPGMDALLNGSTGKRQVKSQANVTAGPKWFNMEATELTPEVERDLQLIRMRHVLDPKRFYKKDAGLLTAEANAMGPNTTASATRKSSKKGGKALTRLFQIGTVLNSPLEVPQQRISNRDRKRHLIDDLIRDADMSRYYKKKFTEVQLARRRDQSRGSLHSRGAGKLAWQKKALSKQRRPPKA